VSALEPLGFRFPPSSVLSVRSTACAFDKAGSVVACRPSQCRRRDVMDGRLGPLRYTFRAVVEEGEEIDKPDLLPSYQGNSHYIFADFATLTAFTLNPSLSRLYPCPTLKISFFNQKIRNNTKAARARARVFQARRLLVKSPRSLSGLFQFFSASATAMDTGAVGHVRRNGPRGPGGGGRPLVSCGGPRLASDLAGASRNSFAH